VTLPIRAARVRGRRPVVNSPVVNYPIKRAPRDYRPASSLLSAHCLQISLRLRRIDYNFGEQRKRACATALDYTPGHTLENLTLHLMQSSRHSNVP